MWYLACIVSLNIYSPELELLNAPQTNKMSLSSWMVGTVPPTAGEIDIIEGVNEGPNNEVTLHTKADGCSVQHSGFSGKIATGNCYIYSTGSAGSGGCGIVDYEANSYGDGFNAAGGGVFATEWTSEFIKVWRFTSSSVPNDIRAGNPDPSQWGTPVASFSGNCDIDSQFQNLHIVSPSFFHRESVRWSSNTCILGFRCDFLRQLGRLCLV